MTLAKRLVSALVPIGIVLLFVAIISAKTHEQRDAIKFGASAVLCTLLALANWKMGRRMLAVVSALTAGYSISFFTIGLTPGLMSMYWWFQLTNCAVIFADYRAMMRDAEAMRVTGGKKANAIGGGSGNDG